MSWIDDFKNECRKALPKFHKGNGQVVLNLFNEMPVHTVTLDELTQLNAFLRHLKGDQEYARTKWAGLCSDLRSRGINFCVVVRDCDGGVVESFDNPEVEDACNLYYAYFDLERVMLRYLERCGVTEL